MLASSFSWELSITMYSFILGHLGTDATAAHSVTNVAIQLVQCLSKGLAAWCFSIPLALLGLYVFHWPVMLTYCVMCIDEIIKLPLIRPYYRRCIWIKNLTRVNS